MCATVCLYVCECSRAAAPQTSRALAPRRRPPPRAAARAPPRCRHCRCRRCHRRPPRRDGERRRRWPGGRERLAARLHRRRAPARAGVASGRRRLRRALLVLAKGRLDLRTIAAGEGSGVRPAPAGTPGWHRCGRGAVSVDSPSVRGRGGRAAAHLWCSDSRYDDLRLGRHHRGGVGRDDLARQLCSHLHGEPARLGGANFAIGGESRRTAPASKRHRSCR